MKLKETLSLLTVLLACALLAGCPGKMEVESIDPGDDDDSQPADDDDSQGDDDLTPGDDDDLTPGDDDSQGDDDTTAPEPVPFADCGPFEVPQGNFNQGTAHYSGSVNADRPPGEQRTWSGCEVRRYFDASNHYQCQIYWSVDGEREEWSDPCSVYTTRATYIAQYSDCSPAELGNDDYLLADFDWHYGTEYHWNLDLLSLWSAEGKVDPEIPGGPPGGECGFNGPQGHDWWRWAQNIPFSNSGGDDEWDHLEFEYSTDFRALD